MVEVASGKTFDISAAAMIIVLLFASGVWAILPKRSRESQYMFMLMLLSFALCAAHLNGIVYVALQWNTARSFWSNLVEMLTDSANPHYVWSRVLLIVAMCFFIVGSVPAVLFFKIWREPSTSR